MSIKGEVTGRVVAEPVDKKVTDKFSVLEFPLYSDRRVKNRDTQEYESDPDGTTKVKVSLKFDERDKFLGVLKNKDVVKVVGTFFEREFTKKDGTKGRSLQSDYIESVEIIYSADLDAQTSSANGGFTDDSADASF